MEQKFEIGEIAIIINAGYLGNNIECEIVEYAPSNIPCFDGYWIKVPNSKPYGIRGKDIWFTDKYNLRKKHPPKESKDIRETRERGAPSFNKMMESLSEKHHCFPLGKLGD